jgi:type IV pilus assembly protein PilB
MQTGYKGRIGVYEVLIIDDFVQDLILKRTSAHEIIRLVKEVGDFTTLKDSAAEKVIQGITSLEEAASAVMI